MSTNQATADALTLMTAANTLGAAIDLVEHLMRTGVLGGEDTAADNVILHGETVASDLRRLAMRLDRAAVLRMERVD